jgi:hypothetical protein
MTGDLTKISGNYLRCTDFVYFVHQKDHIRTVGNSLMLEYHIICAALKGTRLQDFVSLCTTKYLAIKMPMYLLNNTITISDDSPLGFDTMLDCHLTMMLQRNMLPPYSG